MKLENRTAIVTGGSSGIGRESAIKIAQQGADVIIADVQKNPNTEDESEPTTEVIHEHGQESIYCPTNVANKEDVQSLIDDSVEKFGGIDILVNNAGISAANSVEESSYEEWQNIIDVNLNGVFLCSKYALPHLKESSSGRIINISSQRGLSGAPNKAAYCASKGAVSNLTRQMALDYGDHGITVNAVCPGPIKTTLTEDDGWETFSDTVVTPFLGEPEDVANAVTFIASDEARYMTGHNLIIDGGHHHFRNPK